MKQSERFNAAVAGAGTDRPPVGAWIHFGSARWSAEQSAAAHLRFYSEYDWDYIKVMNDYRFTVPHGLTEITAPGQLARVGADPVRHPEFDVQLDVLGRIRRAAPDAAVIDTVFSPLQTLVRTLGDTVIPHLRASPDLAHQVLDAVTSRLEEYVARAGEVGVDGLFLAVTGAATDASSWGLSPAEFSDWVAPYDRRVLRAARGVARIIHAHGDNLNVELLRDYPAEVLSWSPQSSGLAIGEVHPATGRVPMLGLDEVGSLYWPPSRVRHSVLTARAEASDRLIVAPGCTLHSDTPPSVLTTLRASVEPAPSLV